MSDLFSLEIVNPEKSFINKKDIKEVVIPGYEGEMGILSGHISLITFLKPGIIKVISNSNEDHYYIEDGIAEFKENNLSILTSFILSVKDLNKNFVDNSIKNAEKELSKSDLLDEKKFIINQKIDLLKSLNIN
tara:strand:+ start:145 stop:543 length:399 start_codon:yes stop_codon:yes gene_type:complete